MELARRDLMLGDVALSLASSTRVLASDDRPLGYAIVGYDVLSVVSSNFTARWTRKAAVREIGRA